MNLYITMAGTFKAKDLLAHVKDIADGRRDTNSMSGNDAYLTSILDIIFEAPGITQEGIEQEISKSGLWDALGIKIKNIEIHIKKAIQRGFVEEKLIN